MFLYRIAFRSQQERRMEKSGEEGKGEVGEEGIEVEGPRLKGAVVNWSNQTASDTNLLARKDGDGGWGREMCERRM